MWATKVKKTGRSGWDELSKGSLREGEGDLELTIRSLRFEIPLEQPAQHLVDKLLQERESFGQLVWGVEAERRRERRRLTCPASIDRIVACRSKTKTLK